MLNSRKILQYFIEYEKKTALMGNSITHVDGELFNDEQLRDPVRLNQLAQQKKKDDIFKKIIEYPDIKERLRLKKYKEDEIKNQIDLVVSQDQPTEELLSWLSFKYPDNKVNTGKFINNLLDDTLVICYPLLKKKTKNETSVKPLITFICRFEESRLKVEQFFINRESLEVVIAKLTNNSTLEIGELEKKNLLELINANEYTQQKDLFEILEILNRELTVRYGKGLQHFKSYEGWQKLNQAFVTFEMLEEMKRPIFQKEIERILELTRDELQLPELLHTYLIGGQTTKMYTETSAGQHLHYGSYTGLYPINEKQWHIIEAVQHHKLLSVNGPPGTGKSTLLKEIFADYMVQKAKGLMDIWEKPWVKFTERRSELYSYPLTGTGRTYSMVLTSTNNKAVDNIGLELLNEVSYFQQFVKQKQGEKPYSGFFCARLGNATNKEAFIGEFVPAFLEGLERKKDQEFDYTVRQQFVKAHEELEYIHQDIDLWSEARETVRRFFANHDMKLMNAADDLSSFKMELEGVCNKINEIVNSSLTLRDSLDKMRQRVKNTEDNIRNTEVQLLRQPEKIRDGYKILEKYRSWKKRSWYGWIFPSRRVFMKKYVSEVYIEDQIIQKNEKEEQELRKQLLTYQCDLDTHRSQVAELEEKLEILEQEYSKYNNETKFLGQIIEMLKSLVRWEENLCEKWGFQDVAKRSKFDFAKDHIILKKRHQLFELSLKVTEQYVLLHAEEVMHNLKMVCQGLWFQPFYNEGNKRDMEYAKGIRALWDTLFLCFPVVTSTLHSFGERTFHLLPELIDTLLVDEAGQIMPHYLSSPLFRSQKAIIVGDIEQLEPVRLLKSNVIEEFSAIPEKYHDLICVQRNSAQSYIDRNSDIYELDYQKIRKGMILTEHRRCEESIMLFSNRYVYGNILSIVNKDNYSKLFGGNLVAIDVRGLKDRKAHINLSEVQMCKKLVDAYVQQYGVAIKNDIGIITPFTKQKEKLKDAIPGVEIGTVHTFQGQEKKIIFFSSVIDSFDPKQQGLAFFVGGRTNLLNVALSRAKEQFVLVGNLEVISNLKNNHLYHVLRIIMDKGIGISPFEEQFHTVSEELEASSYELYTNTSYGDRELHDNFTTYIRENIPEHLILTPKDHYLLLIEAIRHATKSVIIFSPWIMSHIVNDEFVELVSTVLNKKVDLRIGFGFKGGKGIGLHNISELVQRDYTYGKKDQITISISKLKEVMGESLKYIPPIHSKILLVDDRYLFLGSHNWLAKLGKVKRDEVSCLITDSRMIQYLKERYIEVRLQ
ncbi:AAA domain-containing protein [Paenibacillus chitinolyticus]|uniref:AAA domain-containing protein n=1 Tax=Paenibacillus chitinolyticus TaxID=79263 RepID=UPI00364B056C